MGKHSHSKSRKRSRERFYDRHNDSDKESRKFKSSSSKRSRNCCLPSTESSHEPSCSLDHRSSTLIEEKLDKLLEVLTKQQSTLVDPRNVRVGKDNSKINQIVSARQTTLPINAETSVEIEENVFSNIEDVHRDDPKNAPFSSTDTLSVRSVAFATPVESAVTDTAETEQDVAVFKVDLLGANSDESITGPPIHDLITKSWTPIFTNGLSKETKTALMKKYPVPQNLPLAKAPALNLEVRQTIPLTSVKRDEYQVLSQGLIEASIAAQASLVSELLKPEEQWDSKRIFEIASDAGRLISHIQYHISKSRRALIMPMLTVSAKNALDAFPIDKQFFGEQY